MDPAFFFEHLEDDLGICVWDEKLLRGLRAIEIMLSYQEDQLESFQVTDVPVLALVAGVLGNFLFVLLLFVRGFFVLRVDLTGTLLGYGFELRFEGCILRKSSI